MGVNEQIARLNKELDEFHLVLGEILPRYLELMKKKNKTQEEQNELDNTEQFLLEVNTKIAKIKNKLDQDLFGEAINLYYRAKTKAKQGDLKSKIQLDQLRTKLQSSIAGNHFFNWN
ncbi:MAG: hypothetical protein P8N52_02195 [Crocinitomicaceae bacterium]|nr:hypothetical protein [Crocinitomicaceae bacterium]MDG1776191.1 hypothetical protein [Crocinitomicaceae bacterium]